MNRTIDGLGRIVIPKEIRKRLKITETTPINIYVSGKKIVLEPTAKIVECSQCGEFTVNANYCSNCGHKLNGENECQK